MLLIFYILINFFTFISIWGPLHTIAFNIVVFALLFAHGKAVFSDPGTVPLPTIGLDFSDIRMKKKGSKSQVCFCNLPCTFLKA